MEIFPAVNVSVQLYSCTTWGLIGRLEKKIEENRTMITHAVWSKFWKLHTTRQQFYCHLPPISQAKKDEQDKIFDSVDIRKIL